MFIRNGNYKNKNRAVVTGDRVDCRYTLHDASDVEEILKKTKVRLTRREYDRDKKVKYLKVGRANSWNFYVEDILKGWEQLK